MKKRGLLIAGIIFFPLILHAVSGEHDFSDPALTSRYQKLTKEFRCLVCQNQSISDSDAELALDLRKKIHDQLELGLSDQEIREYWVHRYGDFIELDPPFNLQTAFLWFAPFILLVVVTSLIFIKNFSQREKK